MNKQQAPQHRRRRLRLAVGTPLALIAAGVIAYGTVFGVFGDDAKPEASAATAPVPDSAMAAVAAMQPGWNLGNTLDAIPDETSWGQPRTTKALLDSVRAQGFKSIRIPVTWSDHQGAAPNYTIDPAYLSRVKQAVDWAIDEGFYVILDVHHDSWQWTSKMSTDHDKVLARFNTTWTQIAAAFRNEPAQLVFESINEPQFDNADNARKAELLNELNTYFHKVVRGSGGNNTKRLLMLPTEVCTPDQRLMDNLATTIKSLHDPLLIATVHYYGYFPFSVNVAGATRFDATARQDMDKTFKRMRDTFVAQGIPVILGEYGLLGYDHGPGAVERGEMLKYFEALGHAARSNKVTTELWDNGSFYDRGKLKWKDAGLFRQIKSSWTTRSATASSDNVFVPKSGTIKDRTLTLNLNGTAFKALKQGSTKLISGKDYTLSGNRLTLMAATLTRLAGDRSYGVKATLQAEFSRGVPWRIQVISHDAPAQSSTTGTAGSFRIPTQFRGDVLATMKAEYADGGNAGPTDWTPYQQFNTSFAPDYAKKEIRLTPAFLDAVKDNARVKLTFHFWSGATATYHVTTSGSTVTGTTS
ncbi:Endoglucanase B [Streptomyces davaonensis JCM 4913]|uniref:Endoglucanase B n=1 Tax=Streptomyces davaonensis (strain DSM 101723 / JCM 4913 / KCC S-0913 / 768) TaxID=1214101 RepID=K4QVL4_STRDJ|nr:cellulase family glycosylhydrolase [Streptomyces davaonensis]CCK24845.1 Endoglucanase B [Streptomyces davaonensis JCM 4913]